MDNIELVSWKENRWQYHKMLLFCLHVRKRTTDKYFIGLKCKLTLETLISIIKLDVFV